MDRLRVCAGAQDCGAAGGRGGVAERTGGCEPRGLVRHCRLLLLARRLPAAPLLLLREPRLPEPAVLILTVY